MNQPSGAVPPSFLSLPASGSGYGPRITGPSGGLSPMGSHPPLHRVSPGTAAFPSGMIAPGLQEPRPSGVSGELMPQGIQGVNLVMCLSQ